MAAAGWQGLLPGAGSTLVNRPGAMLGPAQLALPGVEGRWTQPHEVAIVLKGETSAGGKLLLSSAAGSLSLTTSGLSTPYFVSSP